MSKIKVLLIGGTGVIGSHIKASINGTEVQVYSPTSSELNLRFADSISSFFRKITTDEGDSLIFDYLIYSALDKNKDNYEVTNLNNMKHLVSCNSFFKSWIQISSRAIYDGFSSYHRISPIPLSKIPNTFDNSYSSLMYQEELLLSNTIPDKSIILRLFDTALRNDYSDIINRWHQQIKKWGRCRNEILSPISISDFCRILNKILSLGIGSGTYNVSGQITISSRAIMTRNGLGSFLEKEEKEKTGHSSFE